VLNVELINLFDHSTGNAQNVFIVVAPTIPDYRHGIIKRLVSLVDIR
jgi:hypothetical protein